MGFKTYKVTCQACKGEDIIKITDSNQVFYTNHVPIIAARLRPDMNWGFECQCGNDSRLAPEEKDQIGFLVQAPKMTLAKMTRNLTTNNELKFRMVPA